MFSTGRIIFSAVEQLCRQKGKLFYVFRLLTLKQEEWGDKVTVVSSDMREWKAPEKVKTCLARVCTKNTIPAMIRCLFSFSRQIS